MDNIFQVFDKDSKTASDRARAELAREVIEGIESQFVSVRNDLQPIVDNITKFLNLESNTAQILELENNLIELNAIYNDLSNLNVVFSNISNLNTLYTNITQLLEIFNNITELLNVHGELFMLNALNDNLSKFQDLHTDLSKFQDLHTDLSKLVTLFNNLTLLTDIHGSLTAIETVNTNISDVNDLVLNMEDINILEDNLLELLDIHANLTNIQNVNVNESNINIVAFDISNINTLATNISNLNTIYDNLSDILATIEYVNDTVKHAQNTTSFTDRDGIVYEKGAKGWSIDAETSASNALTSEQNALDSEQKAEKWAEEDEDVEVEAGKYSAKHHAIKAQGDLIQSVDFVGDDMVFTKQDSSTVPLSNAKTTLKGDAGAVKQTTPPADTSLLWIDPDAVAEGISALTEKDPLDVTDIIEVQDINGDSFKASLTTLSNIVHSQTSSFTDKATIEDTDEVTAFDSSGTAVKISGSKFGAVENVDLLKWGGTLAPQKVIAYDFFQRPDGSLGDADSGQTWQSWGGTASITNNIATIDGIFVLNVPSQGSGFGEWCRHLEGVIENTTSIDNGGIIIGKDSSNYLKIYFTDRYLRLESVIDGNTTQEYIRQIATGSFRRYMLTNPKITIYKQFSNLRASISEGFMDFANDDNSDDINLDSYASTFDELPYIGFFTENPKQATGIRLTELT